jgi:hypothetical protein
MVVQIERIVALAFQFLHVRLDFRLALPCDFAFMARMGINIERTA